MQSTINRLKAIIADNLADLKSEEELDPIEQSNLHHLQQINTYFIEHEDVLKKGTREFVSLCMNRHSGLFLNVECMQLVNELVQDAIEDLIAEIEELGVINYSTEIDASEFDDVSTEAVSPNICTDLPTELAYELHTLSAIVDMIIISPVITLQSSCVQASRQVNMMVA